MSEVNKNMSPGFIPSGAQDVDAPEPSYRLLEKKIIFPSIDSFLYHWGNTFTLNFYSAKTKGGGEIYKVKLTPMSIDPLLKKEFPSNIEYIGFAIEHHDIIRDEPSEYDSNGRIHFIIPPHTGHEDSSDLMKSVEQKWIEHEEKNFARLINKLNAQLSLDFPSDHKRGEYFKELCEYKINMSKYAKFKFEKFVETEGLTVIDLAFGWIIDDFKDETATQGITLHLNGYKYRHRDVYADMAIANSQKKRKATLEAKKEVREVGDRFDILVKSGRSMTRQKRCPELRVEVEDAPPVVGDRYEIVPPTEESDEEKIQWLALAKKYGVAPAILDI